jgi:hypothetical protein
LSNLNSSNHCLAIVLSRLSTLRAKISAASDIESSHLWKAALKFLAPSVHLNCNLCNLFDFDNKFLVAELEHLHIHDFLTPFTAHLPNKYTQYTGAQAVLAHFHINLNHFPKFQVRTIHHQSTISTAHTHISVHGIQDAIYANHSSISKSQIFSTHLYKLQTDQ